MVVRNPLCTSPIYTWTVFKMENYFEHTKIMILLYLGISHQNIEGTKFNDKV